VAVPVHVKLESFFSYPGELRSTGKTSLPLTVLITDQTCLLGKRNSSLCPRQKTGQGDILIMLSKNFLSARHELVDLLSFQATNSQLKRVHSEEEIRSLAQHLPSSDLKGHYTRLS